MVSKNNFLKYTFYSFTLLMLHSDGFQVQQSSTMGNIRKLITPLSSSIMNDETMRKSDSDEPFENISLYDLPSSKIKKFNSENNRASSVENILGRIAMISIVIAYAAECLTDMSLAEQVTSITKIMLLQ